MNLGMPEVEPLSIMSRNETRAIRSLRASSTDAMDLVVIDSYINTTTFFELVLGFPETISGKKQMI